MTLGPASHLRRNAVAYLALAIALGTGTAYAAPRIADGSVTTKKLASGAVTSSKIKNSGVRAVDIRGGAVTSFTVADGSLSSNDLATNSVTGTDIQDGTLASSDVKDDSIVSADVKDDSLTRRDINDSVVPQDADVFLSSTGADPSQPTPQGDPNTFSFTLPRNAKVVIEFFAGELGVPCVGGEPAVGLYIDGVPQPGTLTPVPVPEEAGAVQIVTNEFLQAGPHTLTTREQCAAGPYGVNVPDQRVTWSVHMLAR
jgi:hypothetical protein